MCAGSSQSDVQLSMIGGHCGRRVASFSGDEDEDRVVCDSDFPLNFGVLDIYLCKLIPILRQSATPSHSQSSSSSTPPPS